MPQSIQELKDQGPLPRPDQELWPGINPYQQKWIPEEIGEENFERLLQLSTVIERKVELANMTEARVEKLKSESKVNNQEVLSAMQKLGDRQQDCGRQLEAEKTYNDLLEMYRNLDTDSNPKAKLNRAYGLAYLNSRLGNYVEAEKVYQEALIYVREPPLGVDSPQYLGAWRGMIEAVAKQGGRWDDARRLLDEGFELVRGMRGGSWGKFEVEELEAMEEVRNMVVKAEAETEAKTGSGQLGLSGSAKL